MPQRKTGDDPDPRSIPEAGVARRVGDDRGLRR
jgi:hypothetical protein